MDCSPRGRCPGPAVCSAAGSERAWAAANWGRIGRSRSCPGVTSTPTFRKLGGVHVRKKPSRGPLSSLWGVLCLGEQQPGIGWRSPALDDDEARSEAFLLQFLKMPQMSMKTSAVFLASSRSGINPTWFVDIIGHGRIPQFPRVLGLGTPHKALFQS